MWARLPVEQWAFGRVGDEGHAAQRAAGHEGLSPNRPSPGQPPNRIYPTTQVYNNQLRDLLAGPHSPYISDQNAIKHDPAGGHTQVVGVSKVRWPAGVVGTAAPFSSLPCVPGAGCGLFFGGRGIVW